MVSRKKRKWKFSKDWEEHVRILARNEISQALEIYEKRVRSIYKEIERESLHTHQTEGKQE